MYLLSRVAALEHSRALQCTVSGRMIIPVARATIERPVPWPQPSLTRLNILATPSRALKCTAMFNSRYAAEQV